MKLKNIFFYIEKAHDTMWREGLLIKMETLGIGGRLYKWVLTFLFNNHFWVQIWSILSDSYRVDNGIPQGSSISPILFNIMINDVFLNVGRDIGAFLYAEDGQPMWRVSKYTYLVIWFNEQYTLKYYVINVETTCKKVVNLMLTFNRCWIFIELWSGRQLIAVYRLWNSGETWLQKQDRI